MLRYTFHFKKQHRVSTQERFKRIQAAKQNESSVPISGDGEKGNGSHAESQPDEPPKITVPPKSQDDHEPAEIITINDIKKHAAIPAGKPAQTTGQPAPVVQQAPKRSSNNRKANLPADAGRKISRHRRGRNTVKK